MEPQHNPYIPEENADSSAPSTNANTIEQKKNPTLSTPMAIIVGAIVVALGLYLGLHRGTAPTPPSDTTGAPTQVTSVSADVAKIRPTDYVRGDMAKAQVALIEYSDSDCPFCMRFHPTLTQLVKDYNGKVVWVYRFFPLTSLHPNAYTEALALQCVGTLGGNAKFWDYLDIVINVTLNPDPKSNEALTSYATGLGVNKSAFTTCMASAPANTRVDADSREATKIGAQGTPFTIAVNLKNGKQAIIPGAYPIDQVKAAIDSLLK